MDLVTERPRGLQNSRGCSHSLSLILSLSHSLSHSLSLMKPNWQIRLGTQNRKLGPRTIVVTLDRRTCPEDCALRGSGCYAESGPLAITWARVSRGEARHDGRTRWSGSGFRALRETLAEVSDRVRPGSLFRFGDAGDPSVNGQLSPDIIEAAVHLRRAGHASILYTHAPDTAPNRELVALARRRGITVNRSVHGPSGPQSAGSPGSPWSYTTTVPENYWGSPADTGSIIRCPAETSDTTCDTCRLCAIARKPIGFTAHGARKRTAEEVSA